MKLQGKSLFCPGFYDEDHFRRCNHKVPATSIPRPAWVDA